jgi:uncharacterized cupin superfamily protein
MITRRDIIVSSVTALATLAVAVLAQSDAKPLMRSRIFDWNSLKPVPTKSGERRDVFNSATATLDNFECHISTLNPGQVPHPPHRHAEEELMILKEGTLEAIQNDRTNVVAAGGIIFEGSNELHGIRNVGTKPATYYVLKWTPPGLTKSN